MPGTKTLAESLHGDSRKPQTLNPYWTFPKMEHSDWWLWYRSMCNHKINVRFWCVWFFIIFLWVTDNTNNICHILNSFYCITVSADYYQMCLFFVWYQESCAFLSILGCECTRKKKTNQTLNIFACFQRNYRQKVIFANELKIPFHFPLSFPGL